jgi:hypothetical protein
MFGCSPGLSVIGLIPGSVSNLYCLGRGYQANHISLDEEACWLGDSL